MKRGSVKRTSFKPGVSGNPGGRPRKAETIETRKTIADVKELAKELTHKAMMALEEVVESAKSPAAARVAAATVILDRAWGKPQQDVSVTQTFDVADRIIARWKQNLAKLNAEDPLKMIEGRALDVTPAQQFPPR